MEAALVKIIEHPILQTGIIVVIMAFLAGRYKEKFSTLTNELTDVKKDIKELLTKLDKFANRITKLETWRELTDVKSPLKLSERGKEILEKSGFMKLYKEIKNELISLLELKKPTTKYEVQLMAEELTIGLIADERFRFLQTYAYENPNEDPWIVLRAGGLVLRDDYLEKHSDTIKE